MRSARASRCRVWVLGLEAEAGGEWYQALRGVGDDTLGYFFMLGVRHDF